MVEVIWTPDSLQDLKQIFEFISQNSLNYAEKTIDSIFHAGDSLKDFPFYGRIIPEIGQEDSREIFYKSWRIMYLIRKDIVFITAVIHSSRNSQPGNNPNT